MEKNKVELISFAICPFVQRATIALNMKKVKYDIKYIDLKNKPEWFLKISPLGKVPLLIYNGEVLFESSAILEFLDDEFEPQLHPHDNILKAKNRAFIEIANQLFMALYAFMMSENKEKLNEAVEKLEYLLMVIENKVSQTENKFFNGEQFGLIDAFFAPAFYRLKILNKLLENDLFDKFPSTKNWKNNLLELEEVKKSVLEDFEDKFISFMKASNNILLK